MSTSEDFLNIKESSRVTAEDFLQSTTTTSTARQFLEETTAGPPVEIAGPPEPSLGQRAAAAGIDPKRPELWQELEVPWWKKVLEFASMGHIEAPRTTRPPPPEVEYHRDIGQEITRVPRTARLGIEEDPLLLPLMAGGAGALRGGSAAMRFLRGTAEGAAEITGGITDVPRVAKDIGTEVARRQFQKKFIDIAEQPKPKKWQEFLPEEEAIEQVKEFSQDQINDALDLMYDEIQEGAVQYSKKGYRIGTTYPKWFGEGKWSKKEFNALMEKVEEGKPLTEKQFNRYQELKEVAQDYLRTHPEFMTAEDFGETLYSGLPISELTKTGELWTKYVGKPIWDKWLGTKLTTLMDKVPGGKAINRARLYEYRGDLPRTDKYLASMEDMKRAQAIGREYGIDLGKRLQEFDQATQIKMGQYISGETDEIQAAAKAVLHPRALAVADEARQSMLDLGKQAVDAGLLNEEVFFKNAGRYMPRLYTSKEYQSLLTTFNLKKPTRLDLSRFKKRKDIPKEIREQMGEILTPGYPIAKGVMQLTHDIGMARHFNGIAENPNWAWIGKVKPEAARKVRKYIRDRDKFVKAGQLEYENVIQNAMENFPDVKITPYFDTSGKRLLRLENANPIPEGWKQIEGKKLGSLDGAYVHPEIFEDLQQTIKVMNKPEKYWRKALGMWKFGKVILSPKTHARNLMSNSILAHLGGMPIPMQPVYLAKAAKQLKTKGEYWQKIRELGGLDHTWASGELKALFDNIDLGTIKADNFVEKLGKAGEVWQKSKNALKKAADIYEAEEQWFKIAKYMHNIERRNMIPEAAWKDAEKWLFNYSKVTKFQEKYRSQWYGAPFATFTFKAMPRIAEAWIKTPWRFAMPAAIIVGMEEAARRHIGETREEKRAKKQLVPDWMKGKTFGIPNFAKVPLIDDDGREQYLNLTYVLPWGDIGEGGKFGPIPGGITPFSQPFIKEPMQQILNYDSFWKEEIVKEEEVAGLPGAEGKKPAELWKPTTEAGRAALAERGKHAFRAMAPTPFIDAEKIWSAFKDEPDYRGRFRNRGVALLDAFAGLKIYPVDYNEQMMKLVNKLDPRTGFVARKLMGRWKTLEIKRKAAQEKGRSTKNYDKQIDKIKKQLTGLGQSLQKKGEEFKKIK